MVLLSKLPYNIDSVSAVLNSCVLNQKNRCPCCPRVLQFIVQHGTLAYLLFRSLIVLNHHSTAESWPLHGLYSARVAVTEASSLLCTFWNPRPAFSASVLPLAPNSRPQQYARLCQLPLSWQWAAALHHEAYRRWPRGRWALLHTLPWIPGRARAHSQREAHQQAAARVCHHGPSDRQQIRWVPCCRDCNPSFVVWNITLLEPCTENTCFWEMLSCWLVWTFS